MSRALTTLLVATLSLIGRSGHAESDVRFWSEIGVEKQLTKKLELNFDQQTRFDQNVSRLEAFMPEVTLWWRVHRYLHLGIGYRFQYRRDNDDQLVYRDMGFVMVRPRIRVGPVRFTYRARYQEEVRGSFDNRRHSLRNRLTVQLMTIDPWRPGLSVELFHRIGDRDTIRLRKIRFTAGIEREFGRHEVEVSYRIEVAQEDPRDPIPHIIGLAYHYSL